MQQRPRRLGLCEVDTVTRSRQVKGGIPTANYLHPHNMHACNTLHAYTCMLLVPLPIHVHSAVNVVYSCYKLQSKNPDWLLKC